MMKVGVLGTGNIGKRHIQSIASLKEEKHIFCYDIMGESLKSLEEFVQKNALKIEKLDTYIDLTTFLSQIDKKTIIIISTTAKGRAELLKNVLKRNPHAIIIEKPVCQNLAEYESLLKEYAKYAGKVPVFVNFTMHYFPIYTEVKKKMKEEGPVQRILVNLGNNGLETNGIHMLDFLLWFLDGKECRVLSSDIYETYESKRKGFYDFSGNIKLLVNNKVFCEIQDDRNQNMFHTQIITPRKMYIISEQIKKAIEMTPESMTSYDIEIPYQSQITSKIVSELLKTKTCALPDLKASFLPHKILFEVMEKHKRTGLNIS